MITLNKHFEAKIQAADFDFEVLFWFKWQESAVCRKFYQYKRGKLSCIDKPFAD